MLNGKATIIFLTLELIKRTKYNGVNIFQNGNRQEQMGKFNQTCLIMPQEQI